VSDSRAVPAREGRAGEPGERLGEVAREKLRRYVARLPDFGDSYL